MDRIRDVSYGVVPAIKENDEWKFLLVQQISYRGQNDQFWTFPKGHPETNESIIDTAKRELMEETGIKDVQVIEAAKFSISYSFKHQDSYIDKTVSYFLGICSDRKTVITQPKEIAAIKWCTYDEAMTILTHQNAKDVLTQAQTFLNTRNL